MNSKNRLDYDFIIAGGGCAGLSLAYRLSLTNLDIRVLIVDASEKSQNDRTWCFWEDGEGLFEDIVFRSWDQVDFYGTYGKQPLDLRPYRYKMIRGIDFYQHTKTRLNNDSRFSQLNARISQIENNINGATLHTDKGKFSAAFIFNSAIRPGFSPEAITYLQHFKGWVVQTSDDCFDPGAATLMDFRIEQKPREARFMYILPFSRQEALLEFTVFSPELLTSSAYDEALKEYIQKYTAIPSGYIVTHEEFGSIPMSEMNFRRHEGYVFHIGTAGGMSKASTGYTFTRIQSETEAIVQALKDGKKPAVDIGSARFSLYDSTLLDVMAKGRYPSADVFSQLFKKNKPATVFRFLDEDTSVFQDIRIMSSVPMRPFLAGMLASWRRRQTFHQISSLDFRRN